MNILAKAVKFLIKLVGIEELKIDFILPLFFSDIKSLQL